MPFFATGDFTNFSNAKIALSATLFSTLLFFTNTTTFLAAPAQIAKTFAPSFDPLILSIITGAFFSTNNIARSAKVPVFKANLLTIFGFATTSSLAKYGVVAKAPKLKIVSNLFFALAPSSVWGLIITGDNNIPPREVTPTVFNTGVKAIMNHPFQFPNLPVIKKIFFSPDFRKAKIV